MHRYQPQDMLIERGEENAPVVQRALQRLPQLPVRLVDRGYRPSTENLTDPFGAGKKTLLFTRNRSRFLEHCPAGTPGLVCCNYLVVSLISNCPMDCSYCFLQDYLANNPLLTVYTNVDELLDELAAVVDRQPWKQFRIGTGELSDSLALDPLLGFSAELVPFFAQRDNVVLELKTKTDCVEGLLELDPQGRTVVSWTITPAEIAEAEEHGTASFAERLDAARQVARTGYRLGFHFDPLIEYPDWQAGYGRTIERLFSTIDPRHVAWLSLGSLRLTPALRATMRRRFPHTRLLSGEQVRCADGKWRTFQPRRVKMYRTLSRWLRRAAPSVPVYMCMETAPVWEKVFGQAPSCDKDLARTILSPSLTDPATIDAP